MSKVMLVEDDANLLEIYQARLAAEGFQIVTAKDGEEALAIAVKERPDLIVADIMMPKVSGFDMLDILRSTPETKNVKIIMMTALSQLEDKQRAEKLGANRYLVKSQVTLEDVVRVVNEVLSSENPSTIGNIPVEQPTSTQTKPTESFSSSLTQGVPSTEPAHSNTEQVPISITTEQQSASEVQPSASNIQEDREHRVIEPSPSFTTTTPNIDELLAKENPTVGATPPAINSVISPSTTQPQPVSSPTQPAQRGTTMEPVITNPTATAPASPSPMPPSQTNTPPNNQLIQ